MRVSLRAIFLALITMGYVVVAALVLPGAAGIEAAGSFVQQQPTADPCGPPTIVVIATVANIRSGPGPEYRLLQQLRTDDERPVSGHHLWYDWWQIELDDGSSGWVWEDVVAVTGDVGNIDIITLEDEGQPRPGEELWQPPTAPCVPVGATADRTAFLTTPTPPPGTAGGERSDGENGWSAPINLSRSGLAGAPQLLVDESGTAHALWQETGIDSFFYTRRVGNSWLEPATIEVPFGTRAYFTALPEESPTPLFTPVLVTGGGLIHAFWSDGEGALQYSQVTAGMMDVFEEWAAPQVVAEVAQMTAAAVGEDGRVHIAYMRNIASEEAPVGIYYRHHDGGEEDVWSAPALLYESRYLSSAAGERTQLAIAVWGDNRSVHVAWDNPALEQVFLIRSEDSGDTWEARQMIDRRQPGDAAEATGPSKPQLVAHEDELLLLWQAGHDGTSCMDYYQHAGDDGERWSAGQPLFPETEGCLDKMDLLGVQEDRFIFLAVRDGEGALVAWDGARWSERQPQEALTTPVDPETWRAVTLGCFDAALLARETLVLACATGEVQDVWAISGPAPTPDAWYAEDVWSEPGTLFTGQTPIAFLELLVDEQGALHAFWRAEDSADLRYSRLREGLWSEVVTVVTAVTLAGDPDVVLADSGKLIVVAWGNSAGEIRVVQAPVEEALFASAWSDEVVVVSAPMAPRGLALAGDDQRLYLAYAVPLNEARGIYLAQSFNSGRSWQTPTLVIDGAALEWTAASTPQLAVTTDGSIHLAAIDEVWNPSVTGMVGQPFYARMAPGELGPVAAQLLTEETVSWVQLVATANGSLHRLWQEALVAGIGPMHQVSVDGGTSWNEPTLTSNWVGPAAVAADKNGRLYLLQVNGAGAVEQRYWDGERWSVLEDRLSATAAGGAPERVVAALSGTGTGSLHVLWVSVTAGSEPETFLFAAERAVDVGTEVVELREASPTATAVPEVASAPAVSPTPTPRPTVAVTESEGGLLQNSNETMQLIGGFLPAALFLAVAVAMFIGRRWLRDRVALWRQAR